MISGPGSGGFRLRAMERLERFRGHFYNWYDTQTLLPLHPRYVSSVDSGNLAGSLLALRAGLGELKSRPVLGRSIFDGLEDTVLALAAHAPSPPVPEVKRRLESLRNTLHSANGRAETPAAVRALLAECVFRPKPISDSTSCRSPNPRHADQPVRSMAIGHSRPCRSTFGRSVESVIVMMWIVIRA